MKTIAFLFGGCSPEYSVSLVSASGVLESLDRSRYTPVMVGITAAGDWYHYTGDVDKIADDTWHNDADCVPAALSPNRSAHALLVFGENGVETISIDAVFPILHGRNGEDGTVQGICELAGIPLVGCGVLSSALCMDKDKAHKLAQLAGVRVARSFVLEQEFDETKILAQADAVGYPLFVKPVKAGSSFGITKVMQRDGILPAVTEALQFDNQVVVEEGIPGFEVGCAVMGGLSTITGEIDEIELSDGFFDFTEKYNLITSQIHVPARIPAEKSQELKQTAQTIYHALGCSGFARVDLFLTPDGEIVFNEVNTIPGFTSHSRFPRMMEAAGRSLEEVVTLAIEQAVPQ